jgi:hypothetical protein
MTKRSPSSPSRHYDPAILMDAPEHHAYSRAMGILTWGVWDHAVRPAEERIQEFQVAFPPTDPVVRLGGGELRRQSDGTYAPVARALRLERFLQRDWRAGSLDELLARYGLRAADAPTFHERPFVPAPMRQTAQRRNMKLRVLHGGVDIEPKNMDAAKADYLDRQEKRQAAVDVRQALKQMRQDLADEQKPPG